MPIFILGVNNGCLNAQAYLLDTALGINTAENGVIVADVQNGNHLTNSATLAAKVVFKKVVVPRLQERERLFLDITYNIGIQYGLVVGHSTELAFAVGFITKLCSDYWHKNIKQLPIAATGTLDLDGNVGVITCLTEKIAAALMVMPAGGIVLYPAANDKNLIEDEQIVDAFRQGVALIPIENISEIIEHICPDVVPKKCIYPNPLCKVPSKCLYPSQLCPKFDFGYWKYYAIGISVVSIGILALYFNKPQEQPSVPPQPCLFKTTPVLVDQAFFTTHKDESGKGTIYLVKNGNTTPDTKQEFLCTGGRITAHYSFKAMRYANSANDNASVGISFYDHSDQPIDQPKIVPIPTNELITSKQLKGERVTYEEVTTAIKESKNFSGDLTLSRFPKYLRISPVSAGDWGLEVREFKVTVTAESH